MRHFLLLLLSFCLCFSCRLPRKQLQDSGLVPDRRTDTISVNAFFRGEVKVLYTGCGGLIIERGGDALMTDPFYASQSVGKLICGIRTDIAGTNMLLDIVEKNVTPLKNIRSVLVSHSHYDHLLDLPYLLKENRLNDSVKILGDNSTSCTINAFMNSSQTYLKRDTVGSITCYRQPPAINSGVHWDTVSPHFRVLMIESSHAPHFGCIEVMQGNTCNKKIKSLTDPGSTTCAFKWKKGVTYSFLVDILDDNKKIELRLFIQSSSCAPPYGIPPASVLNERPVDLAFIGVASAQNVNDYPQTLLRTLKNPKLVLIHWENFFKNMYVENPKSVPATNTRKYTRNLCRIYNVPSLEALAKIAVMPKPLTVISILPSNTNN